MKIFEKFILFWDIDFSVATELTSTVNTLVTNEPSVSVLTCGNYIFRKPFCL